MVTILRIAIENNSNNPPIQRNNQPKLTNNNLTNPNQLFPAPALALLSYIWPFQTSQNSEIRPTQFLSMHQALISNTAILQTLYLDENILLAISPILN